MGNPWWWFGTYISATGAEEQLVPVLAAQFAAG